MITSTSLKITTKPWSILLTEKNTPISILLVFDLCKIGLINVARKWLWLFSWNVMRCLHAVTPVVHFKLFEIHVDLRNSFLIWFWLGGALINSQKRNLLFSIRQGNHYFLCLECTMDLRLFLKIWFLIYKRKYQARRSSSGACNLQDIFMVVTGIKMAVACSTSRLRNPRYGLQLYSQLLLAEVLNLGL